MKEKLGFNLAIMGIIASGKDTQANLLVQEYSLKPVNTGLYSRNLLKQKGKDGDWARRTLCKGQPLPMVLMKKFLMKEIRNKQKNENFLFVGGPRLKPEAQMVRNILKGKGENIYIVYLTLPDSEVYRRSLKRSSDKNTKNIYKVLDEKNIIKERINVHKIQVSKTIKYFEGLKILKKINGNQPVEKVHKDIEKTLIYFRKLNEKTT